jgi:hypothetical protein
MRSVIDVKIVLCVQLHGITLNMFFKHSIMLFSSTFLHVSPSSLGSSFNKYVQSFIIIENVAFKTLRRRKKHYTRQSSISLPYNSHPMTITSTVYSNNDKMRRSSPDIPFKVLRLNSNKPIMFLKIRNGSNQFDISDNLKDSDEDCVTLIVPSVKL